MTERIRIEIGRARMDRWSDLLELAQKVRALEEQGNDILAFYDHSQSDKQRYIVYHIFFTSEEEAALFKLSNT